MCHILRVYRAQAFEHLQVDGDVEAQVLAENLDARALLAAPFAEGQGVPLHDDVVGLLVDAVVVQVGHASLQSELLEARDLVENIVKHAASRDVRRQVHLLDRDDFGLYQVCLAFIDRSVGADSQLTPVLARVVQLEVEELRAHQLQEPLARQRRLDAADLLQQIVDDVLIGVVREVLVHDVQVVFFTVVDRVLSAVQLVECAALRLQEK